MAHTKVKPINRVSRKEDVFDIKTEIALAKFDQVGKKIVPIKHGKDRGHK